MREMDIARRAARIGGEIIARHFRNGVATRSKESYNLVTDADVESEHAIVELIHSAFPNHAVLGEEANASGDVSAEHLWVVDPLDGTNNFAHRIPHFAVSIGYYRAGQPQCGVIWNPVRDDWYEVVRGQGATYNAKPARVSTATKLDEVMVGVGFYYDRGAKMLATLDAVRDLFFQHVHGIRRFGTAALDLCHVGCGMYGGYFEYELSPWDFAVGRLFVEEAGGRVTDCAGSDLPLRKTSILASNTVLHDSLLEIVQTYLPPEE